MEWCLSGVLSPGGAVSELVSATMSEVLSTALTPHLHWMWLYRILVALRLFHVFVF